MVRRHFIYQGDKTTAGGVVLEGLDSYTWMGRKAAFHGAAISCPACKSTGHLVCMPPRLPTTLPNGREVALEHDICACRCPQPPTLRASQSAVYMEVEGDWSAPISTASNAAAAPIAPTICLACLAEAATAGSALVVRD